ncbi:MAG TPA: DUF1549 domain-containing protein, partial [Bryobacteraceae bacterium]|nr:DUF1549 domain-containing protein [Bryobacteraceae bacterium]
MGGLRLDSRALAAKSIHAGKSGDSSLYHRVAGIGDQARMPMGAKPLTASEIDTLKRWIDEGAKWPDEASVATAEVKKHWAYIPPVKPALPAGTASHPVDRFIQARLAAEGLKASPQADRVTVLRRASLDLTGLPPTPAEIDAFVTDKSPNAWGKQIDRLLASPHYGERQARHWLDAARYADSDGFEKDKARNVWFYRDWVINAYNRDLPYDRFVVEQLAGDLLPNAAQDQIVATGFLRNSMINEEGGIDPEQFRMEAMFDRIDAIGKAVLGVTVQCAQCHNHKFDPLTQEEYYKLFAFVNNTWESTAPVYTPEEQKQRNSILNAVAAIEAKMPKPSAAAVNWTVIRAEVDDISTGGQKYLPLEDGSLLAAGYAPTKHRVKLTVKTDLRDIRAFRLDLLNHDDLPLGGPGRSLKGTG